MEYKILEQNGIENENIDGGAFNNFSAGGRNCIIKGVLDECRIIKVSSNRFIISKGLLIIQGIRVKIIQEQEFVLASAPAVNEMYQIIAEVKLDKNLNVDFSLYLRRNQALFIQDSLYEHEEGTYQVEFGKFVFTSSSNIEQIQQTIPTSLGSLSSGSGVNGVAFSQDEQGNKLIYLTIDGQKYGEATIVPSGTIGDSSSVEEVDSIYFLPTLGQPNTVYIIKDENSSYRWDNTEMKYYCIGRDYTKIKFINGGEL